jgi:hypothetical protein
LSSGPSGAAENQGGSAIGAALSNSCSALDQLLDILAHQGIRITPVAGAGRINWSVNRSIG